MPSFDIVNRVEMQEIDNAINNTKKEIATRYDFRGSATEVNFDRKEKVIHVVTEHEMKMESVMDMLLTNLIKRKVDPKSVKAKEMEPTSHGMVKRDITIQEGIETEIAKKIVKLIKDQKLKVQAAIQEEQVRVTGKKIDDLQEVIKMLRTQDLGIPLQFINMKS
ncbi:MAG: YajQ family cyclic di-GMP-binding protein [Bacteroidetes bacterium]|nr:YajQ family cyclic di-GMP-binding protein [Bacteroidota bacterium]MCL5737550.1 YajQ family cyclic di-GMP-binding protein [Bacteroidota bacterium]